VGCASGPAYTVLGWCGRKVGGLGPGLTSESADALSGCPANDSSAGSQVFSGTHRRRRPDLPVLCERPGFTGPAAGGCVPSLNLERDGYDHRRRQTRHHRRRGHPRGHARRRRAGSHRGLLGIEEFPVSPGGYARLLGWLGGFGTVALVGIEGTGSYGAGLARHITAAGIRVVEVDRSDRQDRRRQASPIRWMPSVPPGPSSRAGPGARRRAGTARSRRSGR
jgi:hypothetical protein